jgi:GNAT superfamily N-acetyltransferase
VDCNCNMILSTGQKSEIAVHAQRPVFKRVDPIVDREALLTINIEYMAWVAAGIEQAFGLSAQELLGMPIAAYVTETQDKTFGGLPSRGAFYLVRIDEQIIGMGGLRQIRDSVAEIKRTYVRAEWRGHHFGQIILQRLLDDARTFGYRSVLLDTAPFMHAAQRLYLREGFVPITSYPESEVPAVLHGVWRFMAKEI